jgi:predicted CoA-binding protein
MPDSHPFLKSGEIAIFGVSPRRKTFAGYVQGALEKAGIKAYPVHPEGIDKGYSDLSAVPDKVDAAYVAIKPESTRNLIADFRDSGIKKIWLQNGAFNDEIIGLCRQAGYETYTGCLMMYIPGAGFLHKLHRVIHEFFSGKP